jgi:hypothetical protein
MNIPQKLDCIRCEDIPQIVRWVLAEANPWYPVPKIFGEYEITGILGKVMDKAVIHEEHKQIEKWPAVMYNRKQQSD